MAELTIAGLRRAYASGTLTPLAVVNDIFARIDEMGERPIWISLADRDAVRLRASTMDMSLPLAGIPFAVKDNIDVEGLPTTAACPSFAYQPDRSATVVQRLVDAGAIVIGKTNLDQFATGLVGVRSPYGACPNAFDERYIAGGSSSGSALAVVKGLSAFSLGTDTAGSGRVPAAFGGLVGLKPTKGLLSTAGVVPACRSLDCVSVFATTAADAEAVWSVARGADPADAYSREMATGADAAPWLAGPFRFGIPDPAALTFFGDEDSARLFERAAARLEAIGGVRTTIDFAPFRDAAQLLYAGPWVAERFAAVGGFLAQATEGVDPTVSGIIATGAGYSAVDAYRASEQLEALRKRAAVVWRQMDVLLLPTAGTIYTRAEVAADPVRLNTNLGYYTNFVNLLDLAAVAVPSGARPTGVPFGISLIGPAFSDVALLSLAARMMGDPGTESLKLQGCVSVAVVGAHLTGQPLNHQLTSRGARLVRACRTAPCYRLFALPNTTPPKPGLVRVEEQVGRGIELEVWAVPEAEFGSFVAAIPPPLGIGRVQLDSGEWVSGFICEPVGLTGADDITACGGWRRYLTAGDASTKT